MSSIVLSSDTLKAPPSIGEIEYNGKILTATPQANTQRGIVPTEQFFRLDSGVAGANATGAQNIFGVGVALAGSTVYEFEYVAYMQKTAGTTSNILSILFGGTATLNSIGYVVTQAGNSAAFPIASSSTVNGAASFSTSALAVRPANTSAARADVLTVKGTVSVNAGGTFIPQYSLSAAPGGAYTVESGSYMKIKPIGSSGANTSVGTWS